MIGDSPAADAPATAVQDFESALIDGTALPDAQPVTSHPDSDAAAFVEGDGVHDPHPSVNGVFVPSGDSPAVAEVPHDEAAVSGLIASGKIIVNPYPVPAGTDLSHIAPPLRPYAVDINVVSPDPANVNTHPERSIDAIKNMLQWAGMYNPCIATAYDRVIRIGNGRYEAARRLSLTDPRWKVIPVYFANLSPVEAAALAIGDNRSAQFSEWDKTSLDLTLTSLSEEGFNISGIGWDENEVLGLREEIAEEILVENAAQANKGGGDGDGDAGGEPPAQLTGFDFVVPLSPTEEGVVKDALKLAKKDFEVASNSAALAGICSHYLNSKKG